MNKRVHRKICDCGVASLETHFVREAEIVDGRYAPCCGCGRMLDLTTDDATIGVAGISLVTINGSYVLSNGVVVLVDSDIEDYMAGTLSFYAPNGIPEVA